jgi:hypothetical protein
MFLTLFVISYVPALEMHLIFHHISLRIQVNYRLTKIWRTLILCAPFTFAPPPLSPSPPLPFPLSPPFTAPLASVLLPFAISSNLGDVRIDNWVGKACCFENRSAKAGLGRRLRRYDRWCGPAYRHWITTYTAWLVSFTAEFRD